MKKILNKNELFIAENNLEKLSSSEIKKYIYSKGFYDIAFFSDYFLRSWKKKGEKLIKTPKYHKEIWTHLTEDKNINIIVPRGHGKTTSLLIWILWAILYKQKKNILYIAGTSLGEEGISKIKEELSYNEEIKTFFGKLTPEDYSSKADKKGKKWRIDEIELLNGSKVQTLSFGQKIRGKRPDKIIIDDPQENKDVQHREITQKFNEWFFTSLYNTLLPGGSIGCFGTIIGNLCLTKHLRDEKKWKTIEYKAIENGKPLWQEMWSLESLNERKKELGSSYFNQEFLNIPLTKENSIIKKEWIRYYDEEINFDFKILAFDPATSEKEKSDFTGITIIGIKDNRKYVIYSNGIKLSPLKLQNYIEELYKKYSPDFILQEKNIEVMLFDSLRKRGLPIKEKIASKNKYSRLLEVSALLEFGEVFFRKKGDEELVYQLENFPDIKHDDILDSFVYALKEIENTKEKNVFFI